MKPTPRGLKGKKVTVRLSHEEWDLLTREATRLKKSNADLLRIGFFYLVKTLSESAPKG